MNLNSSQRSQRRAAGFALAMAVALLVGPGALAQPQVRVRQFSPTINGLHFANSFDNIPHFTITVGSVEVPIGNAGSIRCRYFNGPLGSPKLA